MERERLEREGGVANGTHVNLGGSEAVFSGGSVNGVILQGTEAIFAGAVASGATLSSGGLELIYGRSSMSVVELAVFPPLEQVRPLTSLEKLVGKKDYVMKLKQAEPPIIKRIGGPVGHSDICGDIPEGAAILGARFSQDDLIC